VGEAVAVVEAKEVPLEEELAVSGSAMDGVWRVQTT
jgi:hypothetical protein